MRQNSPKHLKNAPTQRWQTEGYLLDPSLLEGPIDLATVFPDAPDQPLEIEIGVGKGTFLLARARQRPELNLLGIEYANAYATYTADRIRRAGLTNAKMISADANEVLDTCFADGSVFRIHIYFPDPWPKQRHHRRRLIQPAFVRLCHRLLKPGGQLLIVTDHAGYFTHIGRVLAIASEGFARCPFPDMAPDEDADVVGTNFEKKYARQGRHFHRAALVKYV